MSHELALGLILMLACICGYLHSRSQQQKPRIVARNPYCQCPTCKAAWSRKQAK